MRAKSNRQVVANGFVSWVSTYESTYLEWIYSRMDIFIFLATRRVVQHTLFGPVVSLRDRAVFRKFRSNKVYWFKFYQPRQVEAGVVRVLSELSTSYKEKTQLYCARALCNLACHHGSEKSLVEGGGVAALMMIALVRQGRTRNSATYFTYAICRIFSIIQVVWKELDLHPNPRENRLYTNVNLPTSWPEHRSTSYASPQTATQETAFFATAICDFFYVVLRGTTRNE